MTKKEREILKVFGKAIPGLTEMGKERLLAFGEGMAFKVEQDQIDAVVTPNATTAPKNQLTAR